MELKTQTAVFGEGVRRPFVKGIYPMEIIPQSEDTAVIGQPEPADSNTPVEHRIVIHCHGLRGEWQHFVNWLKVNARPSEFFPYGPAGAVRVEGLEDTLTPEQHYPLVEMYYTLVTADGQRILVRNGIIQFWIELGRNAAGKFDVLAICREPTVKPHFDWLLTRLQKDWEPTICEPYEASEIIHHDETWGEPKRFRKLPIEHQMTQGTAVYQQPELINTAVPTTHTAVSSQQQVTDDLKLPKRSSTIRKWGQMWQKIREYTEQGWSAAQVEAEIARSPEAYKNLPTDVKTIRKIMKAGLTGKLENLP